ncbi:probable polygalacturonase [Tanacetum coccineum]
MSNWRRKKEMSKELQGYHKLNKRLILEKTTIFVGQGKELTCFQVGDGNTDDSQAFIKAWTDLCGDDSQYPTLIIPADITFLLSPVSFNGPCKSSTIHIQLLGNITAPKTRDGWKDCVKTRFWIYFTLVRGLTIDGTGTLDGQGSIWWDNQGKDEPCDRPTALHFHECNKLQLSGTIHINSPKLHMSIVDCEDVDIGYIKIVAPGDSPIYDARST